MKKEIEYATAIGVQNTTVKGETCTFADMVAKYQSPAVVAHSTTAYAGMSKAQKSKIKKTLPYFVGGEIKGRRDDENVKARTLLTLDIEATSKQIVQPPPPQDVIDTLEALGAAGWVYSTLSHTEDAPRYRVVLPLAVPLQDKALSHEALKASTLKAAAELGIADWCQPESWVLSQPMYLPAKLQGGTCWQGHATGKAWRAAPANIPEGRVLADIPMGRMDPVLQALRVAGLYLREDEKQKGKHYITCPFHAEHGAENDTQTVFYEAHHDGSAYPAVKCFDTEPDEGGKPHLTYSSLVNWLREGGHLSPDQEDTNTSTAMEDFAAFDARAGVAGLIRTQPAERKWAWDKFAPIGKVTVLAGPGGVSKSMLMLHLLVYGAMGEAFAGIQPVGKLRSIYVSYEDDTDELHRRMHGLAEALREKDDGVFNMLNDLDGDIGKNLRLFAADENAMRWLLMTKPDLRSAPERTARVEWLIGYLRHAQIKVLVLDPVVYTHTLMESDNGDMAAYMQMLSYIAKAAGVAVVVLHHMGKNAQWATLEDIHQGSLRGASALADNARSVAVMVSMPPKDAPKYGLTADDDTSARYVVLKHAKHNYSASLGVRVFERKGPLLLPREDIQRLAPEIVAKQKGELAEKKKDSDRYKKAVDLAEFLYERPDHCATATQCDKRLGKHAQDLQVRRWCIAEGYVSVPVAHKNGTALMHTLTAKGIQELLDGGLN